MAQNNYSTAYLHTREAGIPYDIFHPQNGTSDWYTGPQYYSLVFLADALNTDSTATGAMANSGGNVVVDISSNMNVKPQNGAGYAIYDANGLGSPPRALVLFNFQDAAGASTSYTIPSGMAQSSNGEVNVRILSAPTLVENSIITYNGQGVNGQGLLTGKASATLASCSSGCSIEIPGPGAAVIMLRESSLKTNFKSAGDLKTPFRGANALMVLLALGVTLISLFRV